MHYCSSMQSTSGFNLLSVVQQVTSVTFDMWELPQVLPDMVTRVEVSTYQCSATQSAAPQQKPLKRVIKHDPVQNQFSRLCVTCLCLPFVLRYYGDAEDITRYCETFLGVDNDNDPELENIPKPAVTVTTSTISQEWKCLVIDHL